MNIETELEKSFGDFGALIGAWGAEKPDADALADDPARYRPEYFRVALPAG